MIFNVPTSPNRYFFIIWKVSNRRTKNDIGQVLNFLFRLLFLPHSMWTKALTPVYSSQHPYSYANPFLNQATNQPLFSWGFSRNCALPDEVAKWMESSLLCFSNREKSHYSFLLSYSLTRALYLLQRCHLVWTELLSSSLCQELVAQILSLFRRTSWREESRSQIS